MAKKTNTPDTKNLIFTSPQNKVIINTSKSHQANSGEYHRHKGITELQYIHSGNGYYFIRDRLYRLKSKSIFLIHGSDTHAYIADKKDSPLHKTSLLFDNSIFNDISGKQKKIIKAMLTCRKNFVHELTLSDKTATEIELFLSIIKKEVEGKSPLNIEIATNCISSLLLKIKAEENENTPSEDKHERSKTLALAVNYINLHFKKELSLTDLAGEIKRSSYHISHIFKSELNLTFKDYLNARRIIAAKEMLEKGDSRKLFAVANEVGFRSLSSFNRNFKKITGLSPSQYRDFSAKE